MKPNELRTCERERCMCNYELLPDSVLSLREPFAVISGLK
jgi:hypothetical protein